MKTLIIAFLLSLTSMTAALAQTATQAKSSIYNPFANAQEEIKTAVNKAKKEHKNVLLQVGGNWCIWCTRFHNFVAGNDTLKNLQEQNYITVHVNYSPENKNEAVLASLGFPQRFGYPVFVILDDKGNRIHTQNSSYLEEGKGYSAQKVAEFFGQWSPKAIDPASYKK